MIVKKFNEAYGQNAPSGKQMKEMFDTFRKYGEMVMNDDTIKELLSNFPDLNGVDNMKVGDYLVSIKIKKVE